MKQNRRVTMINLIAAFVTFAVQILISFWLSPFVVGKIGEEALGFLNLANNFVSYASLLAVAINSMACRYISVSYNQGKKEEAQSYFSSVLFFNLVLSAVILMVSLFFIGRIDHFINVSAALLSQVKLTFLLTFFNMGFSLVGTVYTAAAFTTNLMHYNSFVQIIANSIKSGAIFLLFLTLPARIYYLSFATLLAGAVTLFGNYMITKKLLGDFSVSRKLLDVSKLFQLARSGFWILISNVSNLLLNGLDLLLSNWFVSPAIMGRISLAKQIPFALSNAIGIFSNIFTSALTKVFAKAGERSLVDEALEQLRILALIFTVPYAGIVVLGRPFLTLWLNRQTSYSAGQLDEIYIFMLLTLFDVIVSTYMYSLHSVFIALDRLKKYSLIVFISSCISVGVTVILLKITPLGGYAVTGVSTVVLSVTNGVLIPLLAAELLNLPKTFFLKKELRSWGLFGILCMLFAGICQFFVLQNWGSFMMAVLICAVAGYIISFIVLLKKTERKQLFALLKRN